MKKAQIQLGETIAVLFIFFLMIGFGLIFYAKIQTGSFEKQKEENAMLKAIEITQRAAFLPELSCSADNIPIHNCIDAQKLDAFSEIMGAGGSADKYRLLYYDLLGFSNITVQQVYPSLVPVQTIYLNQRNWTKKVNTRIPVTIYDSTAEIDNQYAFGIISVDVFV